LFVGEMERPLNTQPKYDCGALFGAVEGVRFWSKSEFALSHSTCPGITIILVSSLVFALIAGCLSNSGCDEN
jgi:hypothetical protein